MAFLKLHLLLLRNAARWLSLHKHRADTVDSVPLVVRSVTLVEKRVPEMALAATAGGFEMVLRPHAGDVALVSREIAAVVGIPTAILEFGPTRVKRQPAGPAGKIARFREEGAELPLGWLLGAWVWGAAKSVLR